MISFIKGEIVEKKDGMIVVDNNGIGYQIFVSTNTLESVGLEGETCKIYTYLKVSEDALSLIGFSCLEEKNLFELLISVNGIGTKIAISILSGMKLSEIIVAIASGDANSLSRIKGLGKKIAERIILELKDKVSANGVKNIDFTSELVDNVAIDEAYQILISLGLTKSEAMKLARTNSVGCTTSEEIISKTLKNMGR